MSKQEHPYAQVLRWIADGETVQHSVDGLWWDQIPDGLLQHIGGGHTSVEALRLKPRTIGINGHDVPEPMRVAPIDRSRAWLVLLSASNGFINIEWFGTSEQVAMMAKGLCHATREAAEAHAKALLSFTTTEAK